MERDTGVHPGWEHRFRLACAHMPGVGWRSPSCRPRDSVAACRTGRGPPATDQETPVLSLALTFSPPASSPSSPASSIRSGNSRSQPGTDVLTSGIQPIIPSLQHPETALSPTIPGSRHTIRARSQGRANIYAPTAPSHRQCWPAPRVQFVSTAGRCDDQLLLSLQGWRASTTPCTETAPHSRRRRATAFSWRPVVQMSS